jgi:hypothetical protein
VLNLSGDLSGFITPVMVLLWPIAALGIQALAEMLRASSAAGHALPCIAVTNGGWTDVSPVLDTGSWIATLPAIGSVTLDTAIASSSGHARAQSTQLLGDGETRTAIDQSAAAAGAHWTVTGEPGTTLRSGGT